MTKWLDKREFGSCQIAISWLSRLPSFRFPFLIYALLLYNIILLSCLPDKLLPYFSSYGCSSCSCMKKRRNSHVAIYNIIIVIILNRFRHFVGEKSWIMASSWESSWLILSVYSPTHFLLWFHIHYYIQMLLHFILLLNFITMQLDKKNEIVYLTFIMIKYIV